MTKLELIGAINQAAIEIRTMSEAAQTHVRCPACSFEFTPPSSPAPDRRISCKQCKVTSELRQLHESWCSSRRGSLKRACPGIRWPDADKSVDREGRGGVASNGANLFAVS
jgi:hypothetical protein